MILRIFKYIVFITVACIVSFYLSQKDSNENKNPSINLKKNLAHSIAYSINIKGGKLDITAENASFPQNLDSVILKKINANFISKSKNIKISSDKCDLYPKKKKAFFGPNVVVNSKDWNLKTNSAILDWKANSLSGNSKLFGTNKGIRISASGFSIKENGEIILKHAKITKRTK
ncbi:MAG: hypothetical protein LBU35_00940 [Holosporales bacterium]|jgi:hypothetical protein|nr:hypothetical protein [Holosporales bacterium]